MPQTYKTVIWKFTSFGSIIWLLIILIDVIFSPFESMYAIFHSGELKQKLKPKKKNRGTQNSQN